MDKLTMAHEYALQLSKNPSVTATHNDKDIASRAWEYADGMQEEADKRKVCGAPDAILNLSNSTELDDCDHIWKELMDRKVCKICNKQQGLILGCGEWQPDWSQAPHWAEYWTNDDADSYWWENEPFRKSNYWMVDGGQNTKSKSFGYIGVWDESLRKRPE